MKVYDGIVQGLNEAIVYNKNNSKEIELQAKAKDKDHITSFKLSWHNNCCIPVEEVAKEEIMLYKSNRLVIFTQRNGSGSLTGAGRVTLNSGDVNEFFDLLETVSADWESDYSVEVCDGSAWKIRMYHSSRKVTKICGTVESPPNSDVIVNKLCELIKNGKNPSPEFTTEPKFFGC